MRPARLPPSPFPGETATTESDFFDSDLRSRGLPSPGETDASPLRQIDRLEIPKHCGPTRSFLQTQTIQAKSEGVDLAETCALQGDVSALVEGRGLAGVQVPGERVRPEPADRAAGGAARAAAGRDQQAGERVRADSRPEADHRPPVRPEDARHRDRPQGHHPEHVRRKGRQSLLLRGSSH